MSIQFVVRTGQQLGQQLKSLRKLRGVTQRELGQRIGVGQVRIAEIEANPGSISVDQLMRILAVLGVDMNLSVRKSHELPPQQPTLSNDKLRKAVAGSVLTRTAGKGRIFGLQEMLPTQPTKQTTGKSTTASSDKKSNEAHKTTVTSGSKSISGSQYGNSLKDNKKKGSW